MGTACARAAEVKVMVDSHTWDEHVVHRVAADVKADRSAYLAQKCDW